MYSRHASVPEVCINVYNFTSLRASRGTLMNKFISIETQRRSEFASSVLAIRSVYGRYTLHT